MNHHRASLILLLLAVIFVIMHIFFGWVAYVEEMSQVDDPARMSDFLFVWLKEVAEGFFPGLVLLSLALALFSGLLKFHFVKPYNDNLEELKDVELELQESIEKLKRMLYDKGLENEGQQPNSREENL